MHALELLDQYGGAMRSRAREEDAMKDPERLAGLLHRPPDPNGAHAAPRSLAMHLGRMLPSLLPSRKRGGQARRRAGDTADPTSPDATSHDAGAVPPTLLRAADAALRAARAHARCTGHSRAGNAPPVDHATIDDALRAVGEVFGAAYGFQHALRPDAEQRERGSPVAALADEARRRLGIAVRMHPGLLTLSRSDVDATLAELCEMLGSAEPAAAGHRDEAARIVAQAPALLLAPPGALWRPLATLLVAEAGLDEADACAAARRDPRVLVPRQRIVMAQAFRGFNDVGCGPATLRELARTAPEVLRLHPDSREMRGRRALLSDVLAPLLGVASAADVPPGCWALSPLHLGPRIALLRDAGALPCGTGLSGGVAALLTFRGRDAQWTRAAVSYARADADAGGQWGAKLLAILGCEDVAGAEAAGEDWLVDACEIVEQMALRWLLSDEAAATCPTDPAVERQRRMRVIAAGRARARARTQRASAAAADVHLATEGAAAESDAGGDALLTRWEEDYAGADVRVAAAPDGPATDAEVPDADGGAVSDGGGSEAPDVALLREAMLDADLDARWAASEPMLPPDDELAYVGAEGSWPAGDPAALTMWAHTAERWAWASDAWDAAGAHDAAGAYGHSLGIEQPRAFRFVGSPLPPSEQRPS
ncbi:unnamed protein product [Pedinophyceae sp. YPF-701]|nr:unnamed protein product [Pedinophyceae sp. YPF-701]